MRSDCIEWPGSRTTNGYGKRHFRGKSTTAHRAAWEEANGPIPDGLFVLHRCDNRPCCNIDHLFLGTHTDNMRDMAKKGRGEPHRGTDNATCPLTPAQIDQARERWAAGWLQRRIAEDLGVTQPTISRIVRGRTHLNRSVLPVAQFVCPVCGSTQSRIPSTRRYCNVTCRNAHWAAQRGRGCIRLCEKAGIRVINFGDEEA